MPHIVVKLWPGKSEQQKQELAEALSRDVIRILGSKERSVSVGIEEIAPDDWHDEVYNPDISAKQALLYKKPGYSM
ncbi:4-oxalocrotonate tautomerase [Neokomagataea thailandica NBRC 106555]|uniref:4-oxalocrotonate tautomerase n=2 Tax=Neokomagataea TaxID=1223423 RepID=A0A4Y6V937_9PROT|nr:MULTISPECIES: tautomerase family protein [Neokomagataea]QDH24885.1 4-oxalocrotonate tautomerase [Neokomagataea tanensis]GBR51060.1 4-oxalocrotonate tautomerase [Neokomagataea thailandica NBRC 106555]